MIVRPALLMLAFTAGAHADPLLPPQEAVKKFTAPAGFSVDLIAAEPDIVQPIAFCWDARGRIWVVEAMTYPKRRGNNPPGGDSSKPNDAQLADIFGGEDRILIFADEDGDGKFETRKIFAEKLNLVSGIELGFGGLYVGAAPYLLHIPDKDADDKPDGPPEILLDGWGWQDTHETLNSFIWGPDGWLYGCHGVFTHSNVRPLGVPPLGGAGGAVGNQPLPPKGGTPNVIPINCGYWRYHPVRRTFEVFAHGTSNSWGFDYNEYGDWFSEACVIPHFWHIIQGGYYLRQSNPLGHFNPYVYTNIETIADHLHYTGTTPHSGNGVSDEAGGGHAHCGLCIYNGDNFPPEYRGRAMMFNIHGQRINQEQLVPEGSGYVAKHLPDFGKANDKNFTGVALKVGPDGAVYFIDWYDKEKCHRPQPEVWDRSNGRIYRVKYDKTWKPWKGDVNVLSEEKLKQLVGGSNGWLSREAIRVVADRRANYQEGDEFRKTVAAIRVPEIILKDTRARDAVRTWLRLVTEKLAVPQRLSTLKVDVVDSPKDVTLEFRGANALTLLGLICDLGSMEVNFSESREPTITVHSRWKWLRTGKKSGVDGIAEMSALAATDPTGVEAAGMVLSDSMDEHCQAFAIRLRMDALAGGCHDFLAGDAKFSRVRLALASALQRLPLDDRWPIAEALIAHGEDAKDQNLPQMYWYAIEPLVPANPERALELAAKSKIPLVSQHIARRLAETDGGVPHLMTALGKEKTAAGVVYLLKAALHGLKGRSGEPAPKGWDSAWANIDDVLARRPDAKPLAAEITDLREALAVSFGDKRAFPRLRAQVKDTKLPVERRELALQTLLDGKDPEIPSLILTLLDDPVMRLAALKALPQATK